MGGNSTLEEFGKNFPRFRFVVLCHQFPDGAERVSHWDLLLEQPDVSNQRLLTFEVPTSPIHWAKPTLAKQLPDHRLTYLSYEGPISGNRGWVTRVLDGYVEWVVFSTDSLVLNLQFCWEKKDRNRPVSAILKLSKLASEINLNWELVMQIRE